MGAIWDALVKAYAAVATVPVVPFFIVYVIVFINGRDRKQAIRTAMDATTAFLIGFVASQFNIRFHSGFGLFGIILVMLLVGGLLGNAQFRARGSIDGRRLFRAVWRLSFFSLSFLYVIFMLWYIASPVKPS